EGVNVDVEIDIEIEIEAAKEVQGIWQVQGSAAGSETQQLSRVKEESGASVDLQQVIEENIGAEAPGSDGIDSGISATNHDATFGASTEDGVDVERLAEVALIAERP